MVKGSAIKWREGGESAEGSKKGMRSYLKGKRRSCTEGLEDRNFKKIVERKRSKRKRYSKNRERVRVWEEKEIEIEIEKEEEK